VISSTFENNHQVKAFDVPSLVGAGAQAVAFSGRFFASPGVELWYTGQTEGDRARVNLDGIPYIEAPFPPADGWYSCFMRPMYFAPTSVLSLEVVAPDREGGSATFYGRKPMFLWQGSEEGNSVEPDETSPYNVVVNGGCNQVAVLVEARGENETRLTFEVDGQWKGWHGVRGPAVVELWEEQPDGGWILIVSVPVHRIGSYDVSPQSCGSPWPWSVE